MEANNTDKQREAFEAWVENAPLTVTDEPRGYTKESLQWAYEAGLAHHDKMLDSPELWEAVMLAIAEQIAADQDHPSLPVTDTLAKAALAVVREV